MAGRLAPVNQANNGSGMKAKLKATTAFRAKARIIKAPRAMGIAAAGTKTMSAPRAVAAPRPPLN